MKKTLILLMAMLSLSTMAIGQRQNDQRTLTTRIADLLAELPARNKEHLESSMGALAAMGPEGLLEMAGMLSEPGKGDNSRLEYALGGFSYYVMQTTREDWRKMSVEAYCQALAKAGGAENKAFLIRQLQVVGKDDAVPCLQNYLVDQRLCSPAASALTSIRTAAGNGTLLQALQQAQGDCRSALVEALGDTRSKDAVAALTPLATSPDPKLRKLSLYALANIADPSSENILAKAAGEDSYTFDTDNAVAAYLLYAERLAEEGQQQQAEKIAQSLLQSAVQSNQVHTRTAALKLLSEIQGKNNTALLVNAASDSNPEYRAAALRFSADYITPASTAAWVKQQKKAAPAVQAGIITMLGDSKAEAALPAVKKALKHKNDEVKLAAVAATGKIGQEKALPDLFRVMRKGGKEEAAAVKNALLIMPGNNLIDEVANALPKMPADGQVALLEVLGARAAHSRINDVFSFVDHKNTAVRMAALTSLGQMARKDNLPRLYTLLNQVNQPEEVHALQQAVIAAVRDYETQQEQADMVLQQMAQASADKKPLYFNILAGIGGQRALTTVSEAFHSGNDAATKQAAVSALASWSDASAARELYRISGEEAHAEYLNQALDGYVRLVSQSAYPGDQKLLLLRNGMEVAKTTEQKQRILQEVQRIWTFPALVYAGQYLEDPALQQVASHAVMHIALSSSDFQGDLVRAYLQKSIELLEGPDSDYQKESMRKFLADMPKGEGFVPLFNGKDLSGWKGLVGNPIERAKMAKNTLNQKQKEADAQMRESWKVENGELIFTGKGDNIATVKKYGDFELFVDWKIFDDGHKEGDAGIYLRGTPQVQIWDTSRVDVGAQVGSGGLYNNQVHPSKPLKVADNPLGEWNNFRILMKGDRVTVYLNGELVTDNVILENYWDRSLPIFPEEQLELQAHGSRVAYRDIYIRELPRPEPFVLSAAEKKEGFQVLFDGTNMHNWQGNTADYVIEDGVMVVHEPKFGSGGNLYTKDQYEDFIFRFEFKLTPGANNGLGIRTPLEGDPAYVGMELQILDNDADIYKNLEKYQYHGSVYGVIPAKRGYLKPVGEWNYQEVTVKGNRIKVVLNGTTILDGDIAEASRNGTLDKENHPGLKRTKGHIGFLGHGSTVWFRNIRLKDLSKGKGLSKR